MGEKKGKKEFLARLIRGGELYTPDYRGKGDVLIVGSIVAKIAPQIPIPKDFLEVEIVEAADKIITPGFIDQHVHMIGAGGTAGPVSRTREIRIQQITQAGVTTAVGSLGLDDITRDMKRLLVKAKGLEEQGITTFVYTGSYAVPSITLTGSIETDFLLIDKVVGVKLGLGEPLSTYPMDQDIKRLLSGARRGGLLSGKAGIVHIHMGECPGKLFESVAGILQATTIPMSQVVFTHCNRSSVVFQSALEFAKKGGMLDMTGVQNPDLLPPMVAQERLARGLRKPSKAIEEMLAAGIGQNQMTMSSDSNAGGKTPDGGWRYGSIMSLYVGFKDLAQSTRNISLALQMVTLNPATRLGILSSKGTLDEGKDADLLVMTRDLQIEAVYARGKIMVKEGEATVKDPYE